MRKRSIIILAAAIAAAGCVRKGQAVQTEPLPVKVESMTVEESAAPNVRRYSGTIEAQTTTSLSFSTIGTVSAIHVSEGQFVNKGQLVAEIDPASLQSAYDAAKSTLDQAEDAYRRMRNLHDQGVVTDIKWVEVQTQLQFARSSEAIARKALEDAKLYAPESGYIAKRSIEVGQTAAVGIPAFQIVRIDPVKVSFSVPEQEVSSFRNGMKVELKVGALGGETFTGTIVETGVSADVLSRTYPVKAIVRNPGRKLLVGMLCDVWKQDENAGTAILIPAGAVQLSSDNSRFVWVIRDGKAYRRQITTGGYSGELVVASEGLAPGEKVITEGARKVSEGMDVIE